MPEQPCPVDQRPPITLTLTAAEADEIRWALNRDQCLHNDPEIKRKLHDLANKFETVKPEKP